MNVAVCVCTCNRPKLLERLLDSLRAIELGRLDPRDVAIIVVDNNPTGEAQEVCEAVSASLAVALHFVAEPERGISFARNRAVDEALSRKADFIAFIDDDDLPEPDWLLRLLEKQSETQADLVAGSLRPLIRTETPAWLHHTQAFDQPRTTQLNSYGIPSSMGTGNVLIGRRIVEHLTQTGPLFSPELGFTGGEDRDFFIRAKKQGALFAVAERSVVNRDYEDSKLTPLEMAKRAFRLGCSTLNMARRHGPPGRVRRRSVKALFGLLTGVLLLPLSLLSKSLLMRNLHRMSKELGVLYSYAGGRYGYYR